MSMGTIAIAFLALGGFLLITSNLQRFVQQWMESAELSVFLRDDIAERTRGRPSNRSCSRTRPPCAWTTSPRKRRSSGSAATSRSWPTSPRPSAPTRFPPRSRCASGPGRRRRRRRGAPVARRIAALDGVADVQFDRRWLERVLSLIAGVRDGRPRRHGRAAARRGVHGDGGGPAVAPRAPRRARHHAARRRAHLLHPRSVRHRGAAARGHRRPPGHPRAGRGLRRRSRDWLGADWAGLLGGQPVGLPVVAPILALLTGAGLAVGVVAGFVASRAAR